MQSLNRRALVLVTLLVLVDMLSAVSFFEKSNNRTMIDSIIEASVVGGAARNTTTMSENRVYHGERVYSIDDAPYMVSIRTQRSNGEYSYCSGFFINNRNLVTAAHCVLDHEGKKPPYEKSKDIAVRHHVLHYKEQPTDKVALKARNVAFDKTYDVYGDVDKDFAIVNVWSDPDSNSFVPFIISESDDRLTEGKTATIYGYGQYSATGERDYLRTGEVVVSNIDECKDAWDGNFLTHILASSDSDHSTKSEVHFIGDDSICTKEVSSQGTTGDAGAPLIVDGKVAAMYIIGSAVPGAEMPAINLRASKILKFILENTRIQIPGITKSRKRKVESPTNKEQKEK